jgi:undecaprenyl-diphosphatase
MDILDSIILGIVQGLTEFLPVSSSGHLELGKAILGDNSIPEESLLFTVVLHFATALSTIVVFRKDILDIIKGLLSFKWNEDTKFIAKIILSMIPAI